MNQFPELKNKFVVIMRNELKDVFYKNARPDGLLYPAAL
jgi:hypothetical protein